MITLRFLCDLLFKSVFRVHPATFPRLRGYIRVNRKTWLVAAVLMLVAVKIVWYYYSNWGLITIHADKQPLSKIVSQIQWQGHVTLKTNLDPSTRVTMHVDRVPVSDALETLSVVTESRWRLNYFLAPDKAALRAGIEAIAAGNKPDDWKVIYYPFPQMFVPENGIIPDPRRDEWPAKAPEEATLQANLDGAAKLAHVGFALPEKWNPAIASPPTSGLVSQAVPKLAGKAHGRMEPVFLLTKNERRQGRGEGGPPDGGPNWGGGGQGRDPDAMAERALAEINRLPAGEQAAAKAEFDSRQAFFKQLRDLPPDQRRAKMQELMNDPQMQDQMDKRQAQRDARNTPDQKLQRAQNYVDRKQAILHPQ